MKKNLFIVFLLVGLTASAAQAAGLAENPTDSFLAKVGRFFGLKAQGPSDPGKPAGAGTIGAGRYANSTSGTVGLPCTCTDGGNGSGTPGIMAFDSQGTLFCCCPPPERERGPRVY